MGLDRLAEIDAARAAFDDACARVRCAIDNDMPDDVFEDAMAEVDAAADRLVEALRPRLVVANEIKDLAKFVHCSGNSCNYPI
jgi:hypothetical protein